MGFIEVAIFILFFAIILVPIANRSKLPLEVFLVIGSCIISLIPGLPNFEINPRIVFNLFLPPILFYAAYFTSWHDFKLNLRPISLLAFGLVIFTMIVVAIIAKWIYPQFSWAECFLLGAIISPTDAASATSIIKKLGAPQRLVSILEGESLVNDATALILFRFSLAAVIASSFSLTQASAQFFVITIGGVGAGLAVGILSVFILQKIHSVSAEITLTFLTALSTYLFGEFLGVSGVIATVVCGIYFGFRLPELGSSQTRIHGKASWDTIIFIINVFMFTLIGFELPSILKNLQSHHLAELIFYGVIVSVAVISTRLVWVFFGAYLSRLLFPGFARKNPMPSWPKLFILGWCGMRGIVSLAAALSLPLFILPDVAFQHRDLIIFITYCVIVVTLILPAFSLPALLKFFHLAHSENKLKQEAIARIRSLEGIETELKKLIKKEKIPEDVFHEFYKPIQRRTEMIQTQLNETPYSTLNVEYQAIRMLTNAAIKSEKRTLHKLRRSGKINGDTFHLLLEELDLEEIRTKTPRL